MRLPAKSTGRSGPLADLFARTDRPPGDYGDGEPERIGVEHIPPYIHDVFAACAHCIVSDYGVDREPPLTPLQVRLAEDRITAGLVEAANVRIPEA